LPGAKTFGKTITCCNWITAPKPFRRSTAVAAVGCSCHVPARMGARRRQAPAMRGAPRKVQSLEQLARGTEIRSNDAQGYKVLTTARLSSFVLCA